MSGIWYDKWIANADVNRSTAVEWANTETVIVVKENVEKNEFY